MCLDTHMKLALYKYAIIIIIIFVIGVVLGMFLFLCAEITLPALMHHNPPSFWITVNLLTRKNN